jgi:hypothetical protein
MAAKSSSCFFGQAVSGEKICLTLANQKKELLLASIFVGQTINMAAKSNSFF